MDQRRLAPRRRLRVPGAPTITQAVEANSIVWLPPASDGGSPITAYRVYLDGSLYETVDGNQTASVDSPGAGTVCEVSAVNVVGEGPKSAPVVAVA